MNSSHTNTAAGGLVETGVLTKSKRQTRTVLVQGLKPLEYDVNKGVAFNFRIVHVNPDTGAVTKSPCTLDVARRMQQTDSKGLTLSGRVRPAFLLHLDPSGTVTHVDDMTQAQETSLFMPADAPEKRDVVLIFRDDGSITVSSQPVYMPLDDMVRLIRSLDGMERVSTGTTIDLGGNVFARVYRVAGNEVTLRLPDYVNLGSGGATSDPFTAQQTALKDTLV